MHRARIGFALTLTLGMTTIDRAVGQSAAVAPAILTSATFVGSTPADPVIRRALAIPLNAPADLVEWSLTLRSHAETGRPAGYMLRFWYGLTVPNRPGVAAEIRTEEQTGAWTTTKSRWRGGEPALVYDLEGRVTLKVISDSVLHVLNQDGTLMRGNGAWSYTLNRSDAAEPRFDPTITPAADQGSRTLLPVATGAGVFGVFEGRTPCQGIARELGIGAPGCMKNKWRVTLFQSAGARQPTTYRVEGLLHRTAREGSWRIDQDDTGRTIYRLAPANAEAALSLLRGDDRVLFILDGRDTPLTGHAEFSYTLDRRR